MFELRLGENIRAVSCTQGPRADGVKCHMVKRHVLLGVFCYCVLGNVSLKNTLVGQSLLICFSALKKPHLVCGLFYIHTTLSLRRIP